MALRRLFVQALLARGAVSLVAGGAGLLPRLAAAQQDRPQERERREGGAGRSGTPDREGRDGRDGRDNRERRDGPGRDPRENREARPPREDGESRAGRHERYNRDDRAAAVYRAPERPDRNHWVDTRYGHSRSYPIVGYRVPSPPPRAAVVVYGSRRYWFGDGVWYTGGGGVYVVTRPPRGVYVSALPMFATVVTIGLLSYHYANGVYYRPRAGGYEVADPPAQAWAAPELPDAQRNYVYPREGQSAARQASDEYECHRWAVGQTGFDPTLQATGQAPAGDPRRNDYELATGACLEGRGYTVR